MKKEINFKEFAVSIVMNTLVQYYSLPKFLFTNVFVLGISRTSIFIVVLSSVYISIPAQ